MCKVNVWRREGCFREKVLFGLEGVMGKLEGNVEGNVEGAKVGAGKIEKKKLWKEYESTVKS